MEVVKSRLMILGAYGKRRMKPVSRERRCVMEWTEIISVGVAFIATILAFSASKLFRAIFWESIKHPKRKVEIEVQDSEVRIRKVSDSSSGVRAAR